MKNFSKPSSQIFSIYIPKPKKLNGNFVYNYYVYDETTNQKQEIPNYLKVNSSEQDNINIVNLSTKIPRYVKLEWDLPYFKNLSSSRSEYLISKNLEKIITEDSVSSNFIFYAFSNQRKIAAAASDINTNFSIIENISQATIIDNYVENLLTDYSQTGAGYDQDEKNKISKAIQAIEKIADRPANTLKINFYDDEGKQIKDTSGFDQLTSDAVPLYSKINSLVLTDVFASSSLFTSDLKEINSKYKSAVSGQDTNFSFKEINSEKTIADTESYYSSTSLIGYIIEKYEIRSNGFVKVKTITIENSLINSYIDTEVKYGTIYCYYIRSVSSFETFVYEKTSKEFRAVTYYLSSNPTISSNIICTENVPPPPPVDVNFVWDYLKKKINIIWGMPVNPQRDILQFQVFRRSSINEPFELIGQKTFDYSTRKFATGEVIDGNRRNMTREQSRFVEYEKSPSMMHVDDDFFVDIENLNSSKYIYAVSSIDAHGMVSNYSSQFEVSFDFFKNKLVKKNISSPGAPRQYPNMYLNVDLFKDVIKTSGAESFKMKIYFMPEYFKISRGDNSVETLVSTKQKNSFYKLQFINLQNQKSDSLKITIDDPNDIVGPES